MTDLAISCFYRLSAIAEVLGPKQLPTWYNYLSVLYWYSVAKASIDSLEIGCQQNLFIYIVQTKDRLASRWKVSMLTTHHIP